ncbi:MAG: hypothetical protein SCH71_10765 [Desulfobulbaceae bacterium]|nr:hypothetical protein [Desulfobulbaceae bacterium]
MDGILKKIFLFVFGASILGIAIINLFIYPSFTTMLIANSKTEATTIGRHMARMIFSEYFQENKKVSPDSLIDINHAEQEFNLYKLKVFKPGGETVYSTDSTDIGLINDKDYFHSLVARGRNFTRVVEKGGTSMDGQKIPVTVIESYVPYMNNGSFIGALEVYLDITEKKRMLQNTLLVCNIVSIGLTALFSAIIMATLMQLDKSINERKRSNGNLEQSNARLNREVEIRKQIQLEKENLINKLKSSLEKVKLLSGFLPICASCKKIRDDKGYWNQIESFIREHSEAEFSHGICPDCAHKHYGEFYPENQSETVNNSSVNTSAPGF